MEKQDFYNKSSEFLKSMANPIRLEIIDLLIQGERPVESIANALDLNLKTVSSYLNELHKVKIVDRNKVGKQVYYSIKDKDFLSFFLALRKLTDRKIFYKKEDDLSLKETVKKAKEKKITILDTRPSLEYDQGHLPESVSIPLEELKNRFLELPKGKTIYLYCRGPYCTFSEKASSFLEKKGFKTVILSKGVLDAIDENIKLERNLG